MEDTAPTHNEMRVTARRRSFRAAVACLALSLAVLAIAAKTLHYSHQSPETRYFSSSVKIVKAGPKEFGSTAPVSVIAIQTPRVIATAPPPDDFAQINQPEIPPARAPHSTRQLLRGPPSIA